MDELTMRCPMCRAEIDAAAMEGICASCPLYAVSKGCRLELIPCPGCGYHSLAWEHEAGGSGRNMARKHDAEEEAGNALLRDPGAAAGGPGGTAGPDPLPRLESLQLPTVEECNGALRLSELPAGTTARLLGFNGLVEKDLGRLTAHGLLPGVQVEVIQRVPAVILGVYQTELALDLSLAAGVWVVPKTTDASGR